MNTKQISEAEKRLHRFSAQQARMNDGELPVLQRKRDYEPWTEWRNWRERNGLDVGFMDTRQTWTVPTVWPPVGDDWGKGEGSSLASRLKGSRRPEAFQ